MRALVLCLLMLLLSGCDYLNAYFFPTSAPKSIWVDDGKDGQSMLACKGDIRITPSDAGYQIEFTDADGLNHALYGIKRFSLADVPPLVRSTLPYPLPDLYSFNNKDHFLPAYSNGQLIHNGDVVTWATEGAQGKFVIDYDAKGNETNRHWEAILVHNKICDPTT